MTNWRPDNWRCEYLGKKANKYFELGADAMLDALYDMAKKSPTGTFTIDSHEQHVYSDDTEEGELPPETCWHEMTLSDPIGNKQCLDCGKMFWKQPPMWRTHYATKVVGSGYFCPECGRQISNRSESHICKFNG